MTSIPTTVSTKDWLGHGKIMPFPIPSETQEALSSATDEEEVTQPDNDELFDEMPETDQLEAQTVS